MSNVFAGPFSSSLENGMSTPSEASRRATTVRERVVRLSRLLLQVARMWVSARRRVRRLGPAARAELIRRYARALLDSLHIRVVARGEVPPANVPVLIVANHVSWLDSYVINSLNPARFVAKSEVRDWPVIGTVAARFGTFFLRRGSFRDAARTVAKLSGVLRGGYPVAAFPEGTTSRGDEVNSFYPAMFQSAVNTQAMVQPIAMRYLSADGTPCRRAAIVGNMTIWDYVRLLLAEPELTVEVTCCPLLWPTYRTRRELAALSRESIATVLSPDRWQPDQPFPERRAA
jgi:1-acyl-sn-glycerol-3-phosphate acyltransferase